MKSLKAVVSVVAVLLFLSLSAFGRTHKTSLEIPEPVTVAGVQLAPGWYQLDWIGVGPSSQVTFKKDGHLVLTTTASVLDLSSAYGRGAAVVIVDVGPVENGSKTLTEIDLPKQTIILHQSAEMAQK